MKTVLSLFLFLLCFPIQSFSFCFEEAGERYGIAPALLRAIAEVESNFNPVAINKNGNGTYDYGLMQINSSWVDKLGMNNWGRLGDPCYNVMVGAWILSQCISRYGYTWESVGCYNATSPEKRIRYAKKVFRALMR